MTSSTGSIFGFKKNKRKLDLMMMMMLWLCWLLFFLLWKLMGSQKLWRHEENDSKVAAAIIFFKKKSYFSGSTIVPAQKSDSKLGKSQLLPAAFQCLKHQFPQKLSSIRQGQRLDVRLHWSVCCCWHRFKYRFCTLASGQCRIQAPLVIV